MKRGIPLAVACCILIAAPLPASEVGILFSKQVGRTIDLTGNSGISTEQRSVSLNGLGIRGAYSVASLGSAKFAVTATYRFESKADYTHDFLESGQSFKFGTYATQYASVGAQLDWSLFVDLHAGLDVRREKLTTDFGGSNFEGTSTITRPWASAGIGFSFPVPVITPFIRFEASYALKQESLGSSWTPDDLRKAMAPRYEIGIYAGVRF